MLPEGREGVRECLVTGKETRPCLFRLWKGVQAPGGGRVPETQRGKIQGYNRYTGYIIEQKVIKVINALIKYWTTIYSITRYSYLSYSGPYRSLEGSVNMKFLKREDAVSPVIGVILMVAITVILAAVIAAFVFGMASGVSKTKTVALTAKKIGDTISVTYQGGQDDPLVAGYNVQYADNGTAVCYDTSGTYSDGCPTPLLATSKPAVGSTMISSPLVAGDFTGVQVHVVATGIFTDGSSQVILDTYA